MYEIVSGVGKRFTENLSKTGNFTDITGQTIAVDLDLPLNVGQEDEKVYDLLSLYFAKESNTNSNTVSVTKYLEGVAQGGTTSVSIADTSTTSGAVVLIPITGVNGGSLAGRTARIRIQQSVGSRFDLLKSTVQYLSHEKLRVRK